MDSWTMPWVFKGEALRVYLDATLPTRALRASGRDQKPLEETTAAVRRKDALNIELYLGLYGFDISKDHDVFDFVVNTEKMPLKKVQSLVLAIAKGWIAYEEKQ